MSLIKLGIADDHPLVRKGIAKLLTNEPMFDVRTEAASGEELLEKMTRQKLDVVLMDLAMPGMGGIGATRLISRDYKSVKVIGLSVSNHPKDILQMINAGAKGYVLKSANPPDLFNSIHRVHEGYQFFCPETGLEMINAHAALLKAGPATLTEREKEVIRLIVNENIDLEIATAMGLSQKTISNLKRELFERFGVKSAVGLVIKVLNKEIPGIAI